MAQLLLDLKKEMNDGDSSQLLFMFFRKFEYAETVFVECNALFF
jgi:hypothetical protein